MVVITFKKSEDMSNNGKQEEGTSNNTSQDKVIEIADKLCKIVKEKRALPEDSSTVITKETTFDEGLADEPKMLEIYDAIEEHFGISFNDYYLDNVVTLYDIAKLIEDPSKYQQPQPKEVEKKHVHHKKQTRILGEAPKMAKERYLNKLAAKRNSTKATFEKNDAGNRSISF